MRSNLYRKEFTNQDQLQMFKTIMLISTVIIDPQQAVEMANNGVEFCEAGYVDNNQMLTTISDISKMTPMDVIVYLKNVMPYFMEDLPLPEVDLIQHRLDAFKDLLIDSAEVIALKASNQPTAEA